MFQMPANGVRGSRLRIKKASNKKIRHYLNNTTKKSANINKHPTK